MSTTYEEPMVATLMPSAETPAPSAVAKPSFDAVYEAHFDFVWRSLRRLGVPEAHAEDVAQEVFLIVHRKLPGFEGRSHVRTWLYAITRRVARDARRRLGRRAAEELPATLADPAEGPEAALSRQERGRLLDALLASVDEKKREAVVLADLEGMTAPEIAEATSTKLSTVYTRISMGRRQLDAAVRRYRARQKRGKA